MKKISQGEVEREFQKALAVEYVKNYCKKNGLSIQKLRKQNFALCDNECAFYVQPIDYVKTDQLVIDGGPKPQVTLIIVSAKYSCGFSNLMNSSMIVNGR